MCKLCCAMETIRLTLTTGRLTWNILKSTQRSWMTSTLASSATDRKPKEKERSRVNIPGSLRWLLMESASPTWFPSDKYANDRHRHCMCLNGKYKQFDSDAFANYQNENYQQLTKRSITFETGTLTLILHNNRKNAHRKWHSIFRTNHTRWKDFNQNSIHPTK